jgi:hypothetical protein
VEKDGHLRVQILLSHWWEALPDATRERIAQTEDHERILTAKSGGELVLFDEAGVLGRYPIDSFNVRLWCQNDGGLQFRRETRLSIDPKTLARPLRQRPELQGLAALVKIVAPGEAPPKAPSLPAIEGGKVALRGVAAKGGEAVAYLISWPADDGCEPLGWGDPRKKVLVPKGALDLGLSLYAVGEQPDPIVCCGP